MAQVLNTIFSTKLNVHYNFCISSLCGPLSYVVCSNIARSLRVRLLTTRLLLWLNAKIGNSF